MKKLTALVVAPALMLALAAHADDKPDAAAAPAGDYVMLKVDGEDIKKSDVDQAWKTIFQGREAPALDSMSDSVKQKFLREVASEHVLYHEAVKEGLENSPEVQAIFERLKHQVVIQQLLKEKTKDAVTDEKLKTDYENHIKSATAANGGRDEVHARHILVKTKEEADAVEKKLKAGGNFEKIAKEKSQDKTTGAQGGDLGWFSPDKMVPEFSAALLKLKKGEISPPVKTDFGWHVIQMQDWRALPPPPFADVKDSLKQEVGNKAIGDYVKTVMKDIKVTEVDAKGQETVLPPIKEGASADKPAAGKDDKDDDKDAPAEQ